MDKKLFFVIGSILVVIILAVVWGYLLFFGSPSLTPVGFSNLDLGDTTDTTVGTENQTTDTTSTTTPVVDVTSNEPLRQLTMRPVAGFQALASGTSTPDALYFVEAGTGHIYSIDLASGEEVRRSGTTIAMATDAHLSPDGSYVLMRSGEGDRAVVQLGTRNPATDGYDFSELSGTWLDYRFTPSGALLLAEKTELGVTVSVRDLTSGTTDQLFTVPFREAVIAWGTEVNDTHYVYPKASSQLDGYLYAVERGILRRQPIAGQGLIAVSTLDGVLYSTWKDTGYESTYFDRTSNTTAAAPIMYLPEKCAADTTNNLAYCGAPIEVPAEPLPDAWYQGSITISDALWEVDAAGGGATLLALPTSDVGRVIDTERMTYEPLNRVLYFTNKVDNTLGLYDL